MKQIAIYFILFLSLFTACKNDQLEIESGNQDADDLSVFRLIPSEMPVVTTRSVDNQTKTIENVAVFSFDEKGIYQTSYTQSSSNNITSVSIYLDKNITQTLYVVCNHPDYIALEQRVKQKGDLASLKAETISIEHPDDAFSGSYVMVGQLNLIKGESWNRDVILTRLTACFDFSISYIPDKKNEDFKITSVSVCNIPRGSSLLSTEMTDSLQSNTNDYVYNEQPNVMKDRFFLTPCTLKTEEKTPVDKAVFTTEAFFHMFENRRGQVDNVVDSWPELKEMSGDPLYIYYKQLYKRLRAKDYPNQIGMIDKEGEMPENAQFRFATYLLIEGVYRNNTGSFQTKYYVYLGYDAYKDFNVCRNTFYKYDIRIKAYDKLDTRVTGQSLDGLTVYVSDEELDAHCNVVRGLLYAPSKWEIFVKNPDLTPWLEVSHSAVYKPGFHGGQETATGDEAAFRIKGDIGLTYFYIHTDEYVPDVKTPLENINIKPRSGTIVCRNLENDMEKEVTVTQLPAQMVVCHIKYDIHTTKEVRDTFFIENKLESKNLYWGFLNYWSFITDDLIAAGQWDGLANTRRLYDVAVKGDKWGIKPAYPDGIPYDHALGYILSKNRDRNGNGKIDYDEIVWYWTSANELQALSGHALGISCNYMDENLKNTVHGLGRIMTSKYHSSSPSVADPDGVTVGSSYYVEMPNGKKWIGQRDRRYNVIAARRTNAWYGENSGEAGGNTDIDSEWDDNQEIIMPKNNQ